jgi:hypothetical protein
MATGEEEYGEENGLLATDEAAHGEAACGEENGPKATSEAEDGEKNDCWPPARWHMGRRSGCLPPALGS